MVIPVRSGHLFGHRRDRRLRRTACSLSAAHSWHAAPARLATRLLLGPDQPIFYPVLNRWYATKIAREWNVPVADYRGPVDDQEFTDAETALGRALPAAWRSYLQGGSWLRRGWMTTGAYVSLNTPRQMIELGDVWGDDDTHPGIAIIGGDGARELLVLDLRSETVPVLLVDLSSGGWDSAIRQADDVSEFVRRVEAGTFEFTFAA